MVDKLREKGITVRVLEDDEKPSTPDSIFPNNWFSTHTDDSLVIYPMYAKNRRDEVDKFYDAVHKIAREKSGKDRVLDYRDFARSNQFLEGTGSMVLDRENKIAYCALSPRSDKEVFEKFCSDLGYEGVSFRATQDGKEIYHTNVVMGVGKENVIICLEAIEQEHREELKNKILSSNKKIIEISLAQVKQFLGNTLELVGSEGKRYIAMSACAYNALTSEQREQIEQTCEIIHSPIPTIEFYGGGSVRCMLAEVF